MKRIRGILDIEATPEEAAFIRKLRNEAGWWEGDRNALMELRAYNAKRAAVSNFNPGGDGSADRMLACEATMNATPGSPSLTYLVTGVTTPAAA